MSQNSMGPWNHWQKDVWKVDQDAPTMSKVKIPGARERADDDLITLYNELGLPTYRIEEVLKAFSKLSEGSRRNLLHVINGR